MSSAFRSTSAHSGAVSKLWSPFVKGFRGRKDLRVLVIEGLKCPFQIWWGLDLDYFLKAPAAGEASQGTPRICGSPTPSTECPGVYHHTELWHCCWGPALCPPAPAATTWLTKPSPTPALMLNAWLPTRGNWWNLWELSRKAVWSLWLCLWRSYWGHNPFLFLSLPSAQKVSTFALLNAPTNDALRPHRFKSNRSSRPCTETSEPKQTVLPLGCSHSVLQRNGKLTQDQISPLMASLLQKVTHSQRNTSTKHSWYRKKRKLFP